MVGYPAHQVRQKGLSDMKLKAGAGQEKLAK
jgi:hypothetical protein